MSNDEFYPLSEAAERVKFLTRENRTTDTIYYWRRNGIGGIKLRCRRVGRVYQTCDKWLLDFFVATGQDVPDEDAPPTMEQLRARAGNSARKQMSREEFEQKKADVRKELEGL